MSSGTVKWFNGQKGYGFIQPDDGSKDVFVHITALERAGLRGLNEGQRVTYDLERGQQGKTSAVNLRAEWRRTIPATSATLGLSMAMCRAVRVVTWLKVTAAPPARHVWYL
jgi:cold shock protein